jgi:hypothetical protein
LPFAGHRKQAHPTAIDPRQLAKVLPDMPAIEVSKEVARAIAHEVREHTDRFWALGSARR